MSETRIIFFDTESNSARPNTGFTQLLEITALLVHPETFQIEDQIDEKCRLKKLTFLSPGASFVNKLTEENLRQHMSCYELSKLIDDKFNEWKKKYNLYWIAWNNNFDKNIYRFNAYMNLRLDSLYSMNTQSNEGNFSYEIDALSFAHAISSFGKNPIKIPLHPKTGRPSFQLGLISEENGIKAEGELHTAMVDTKILMEFVKKFSKSEPEIWEQFKKTSHKSKVSELLETRDTYFYSCFYMAGRPYIYAYSFVGFDNDGAAVFVDLLNFNEENLKMSPEDVQRRKGDKKNKIFRRVFTNKNPILINPAVANLNEEQKNKVVDEEQLEKLHSSIQENKELQKRILAAFYEDDDLRFGGEKEFVEDQIYAGFFSNLDKQLAREFHELTDLKDKYKKIKAFTDMRMVHIGRRIIYDLDPLILPDSVRAEIERELADQILNSSMDFKKKSKFTTIDDARDEFIKICEEYDLDFENFVSGEIDKSDLTKDQEEILLSSWKYLEEKEEELKKFI